MQEHQSGYADAAQHHHQVDMPEVQFVLSPAKERAAILMVEGRTQADIARRLGKTEKTISLWKKEPEFQERLQELRASVSEQALEILRKNLVNNITIIQDIAANGGEPGIVPSRLKAAIWAAERVLKPTENKETNREQHAVATQVESLSTEEQLALLNRGR